jgi:hypothetical protein
MNDVCIEECSPKRDCSSFEIKPELDLPTMPAYPETKNLTWKERFVIEEAYLKKTIDFIQGKTRKNNVYPLNFPSRIPHAQGSSEAPEDRQAESHGLCERDGTLSDR